MWFFTAHFHLNVISFSNKSLFPNDTLFGLINGRWRENLMWNQVSGPVFSYASFRANSDYIHTNQHMGAQVTAEPDFRINLVSHRQADWTVPRFSSVCARADKLLDSDVGRSPETFCWVWDREMPNLALRMAISVRSIWKKFIRQGLMKIFEPTKGQRYSSDALIWHCSLNVIYGKGSSWNDYEDGTLWDQRH
jgi:hypothetical protein